MSELRALACPADHELTPLLAGEEPSGELARHLDSCEVCRERVVGLRTQVEVLRGLGGKGSAVPPPRRPAMLGRYLVVGEVGSGGQGKVYRAVHPTLDRELVIKLSSRPLEDAGRREPLLLAEGKLLAQLDHPNLARVYDLDFHEGTPFLVMEYVRGRNLQEIGEKEAVPPRQVIAWVARLARALEVVHRHGIIHQDVKPGNVIIDLQDQPRLLDFGMARIRHVLDDREPPLLGGTPAYMAPEQGQGQSARISQATDVFGLGAVLYFLLTRRPPHEGKDVEETCAHAARGAIDREALAASGASRRLQAICLKALAREPGDRYPDAGALAADLEALLQPRRRLVLAALLPAAALLVLGILGWRYLAPPGPAPGPGPQPAAELQVQVSRQGRYLDLVRALPLHTGEDGLQVVGKVPAGWDVALYHLASSGEVRRLPVTVSPADDFTRVIYPGAGRQARLDTSPGGTELLLLCASPERGAFEDLEPLMQSVLGVLPPLPGDVMIRLDRNEPHRLAPGQMRPGQVDPVAQTEYLLDLLRQRLRDRVPLFQGVAFSPQP